MLLAYRCTICYLAKILTMEYPMSENDLRDVSADTHIWIDKDGRWFYENSEIIHPAVLELFCDSLDIDENGKYRIIIGHELCYIEVEDAPLIVRSISGDSRCGISMVLNNRRSEPLNPEAIFIGENNILYARLESGITVKFSRPAYYSLALMMEESENGEPCLMVKGKLYRICPGN